MRHVNAGRHMITAGILLLGVLWAFVSAAQKEARQEKDYPNAEILADARWLAEHQKDENLIITDVRTDKYFDNTLIPGAIRMPWSLFRHNDPAENLASTFPGIRKAQEILGQHGITAKDTIVLYDSVKRDGGATASYVFWMLDVLGHEKKMILERGIDGWKDAGLETAAQARTPEAVLYQASSDKLQAHKLIDGDFVYKRLGDPLYQIIDVRSKAEYIGEKGTKGLNGEELKLGHIPTAVNINYEHNWTDAESKSFKNYPELQELYRGLDSAKGIIVYCNSGRRSAFSYFVLRLMGFENVFTYEPSWKEWGLPDNFYPVETRENRLTGKALPEPGQRTISVQKVQKSSGQTSPSGKPSGGYVSCGG